MSGVWVSLLVAPPPPKVYGINMAKAKRKPLSQSLRQAIVKSGQTDYAIATGIPQPVITRFRNGTRPYIRLDTADTLTDYLGYSLVADED